MFNLENFKAEITAISAANGNVDIGVATDMFLNNVQDVCKSGDQYAYAGADHVDYAALHADLGNLKEQKNAFIESWGKELWYRA